MALKYNGNTGCWVITKFAADDFSDSWGIFILLSICMHLQVWPSFKLDLGVTSLLRSRSFCWGVEFPKALLFQKVMFNDEGSFHPWLVILPVGNKKTVKPMEGQGAPINGLLNRFSRSSIPTPFMTRRGPPALPFEICREWLNVPSLKTKVWFEAAAAVFGIRSEMLPPFAKVAG